jgi:uncharacterized protein (UPF0305 family)
MTAPHGYLPIEIEARAKDLTVLAAQVRENDELLRKLMDEDHVEARLKAEARVERLEEELSDLKRRHEDLNERNRAAVKKVRAIREVSNGKARNPLVDHVHAIYQALVEAAPDHPLVQREPGNKPEKAALSRTDLRFIYACLNFAQERMGNRSCNDWCIKNPTDGERWFMQCVDRYLAEDDPGYESRKIEPNEKGEIWGPADWLAPLYLMRLMEEIFGKETFEGSERLGL